MTVGVVGAGQLALMMGEARASAGVRLVVLAGSPEDPAGGVADEGLYGTGFDESSLSDLAARCDVVTFDHELVDLDALARLETAGVAVRPRPSALLFAVDKAHQRRALAAAGLPVPRFAVLVGADGADGARRALATLAGPVVVKRARGGYDGRGVAFPRGRAEALATIAEWTTGGEVLVEERLDLVGESALVLCRSLDGALAPFPLVDTRQANGVCVETRYPSRVGPHLLAEAGSLSAKVADVVGPVGIMAIEYFVTPDGLRVNEVALRPHNTAHWTIEGTTADQFAQHLRAVAGLPLAPVAVTAPCAVMVNLVGASSPPAPAPPVPGVFVHDYAKAWRPGRKLGHVTALGDDPDEVRVRAWRSARRLGAPAEEGAWP